MPHSVLRYRVCIWDFDGTLFDSYPIMNQAMIQALEILGYHQDPEEVRRLMKQSVSTALSFYQENLGLSKELETTFRSREKALSDDLPPYPGMQEICRRIVQAGGMNLLYTHRDMVAVDMLRRHGFWEFFDGGVTSEDGYPAKPAPDALLDLMKKHSFSPKEAVMIGDRDIDLLAGRNAGIEGYLFDPFDDYQSFHTPLRGHTASELCDFLLLST